MPPDLVPIRRALISVSDKTGLVELAARAGRRAGSSWSRPAAPPQALRAAGCRCATSRR